MNLDHQMKLVLYFYISARKISLLEDSNGNVCTSHCIGLNRLDLSKCSEATGTKDVLMTL